MIGHEPRFYPRPNLPAVHNNDPNYSLKRFVQEVNNQARFDMNRNTLPNDRQLFDPLGKYYPDQTAMKSFMKSQLPMRNNVRSHMNYFPYPTLPFSGLYYRQMGGVDLTGFGQDRNVIRPNIDWQLDQVGEYCAELLNRDKHYWTDDETALMLELYEENRNYFNDSKTKKTKVWNVIANIINKRFNTSVNSEQCSQKYRNLKAEFLKVVDPNAVDGGAKKFGRHFVQMKRLIEAEEKNSKGNSPNNTSPSSTTSIKSNENEVMNLPVVIETKQQPCDDLNTSSDAVSMKFPNVANKLASQSTEQPLNITRGLEPNPNLADTAAQYLVHDNVSTASSNSITIVSPSNSSLTTVSPTSSTSSHSSPRSCMSSDIVSDEASLPFDERKRITTSTYTEELDGIFKEYFNARDKTFKNMEENQKENVVCLKRCLDIFQKMVGDDILS